MSDSGTRENARVLCTGLDLALSRQMEGNPVSAPTGRDTASYNRERDAVSQDAMRDLGQRLGLSRREQNLAQALINARGEVVTFAELCTSSGDPYMDREVLYGAIKRLRKKLGVAVPVSSGLGYALPEWRAVFDPDEGLPE